VIVARTIDEIYVIVGEIKDWTSARNTEICMKVLYVASIEIGSKDMYTTTTIRNISPEIDLATSRVYSHFPYGAPHKTIGTIDMRNQ
jgi:hypothetical protein